MTKKAATINHKTEITRIERKRLKRDPIEWSIDHLIDFRLIDWLIVGSIDSVQLIGHQLIDWLTISSFVLLIDWLIDWFGVKFQEPVYPERVVWSFGAGWTGRRTARDSTMPGPMSAAFPNLGSCTPLKSRPVHPAWPLRYRPFRNCWASSPGDRSRPFATRHSPW